MENMDNNTEHMMAELLERLDAVAEWVSDLSDLGADDNAIESLKYRVLDDFNVLYRDDYETHEDYVEDWKDTLITEIESFRDGCPVDDYDDTMIYTSDIMDWYMNHTAECDDAFAGSGCDITDTISDAISMAVLYHRDDMFRAGMTEFLDDVCGVVEEIATENS